MKKKNKKFSKLILFAKLNLYNTFILLIINIRNVFIQISQISNIPKILEYPINKLEIPEIISRNIFFCKNFHCSFIKELIKNTDQSRSII